MLCLFISKQQKSLFRHLGLSRALKMPHWGIFSGRAVPWAYGLAVSAAGGGHRLSKPISSPLVHGNSKMCIRDRVWHLDVGSSQPGAEFGPKGLAVRQLKRYASWVQNVVRPVSYTHLTLSGARPFSALPPGI